VSKHTVFPLAPLPPDAPFQGRLTLRVASFDAEKTEYSSYYVYVRRGAARWDLFAQDSDEAPVGYRVYDTDRHTFFTVMRRPVIYETAEGDLAGDDSSSQPASPAARPAWRFTPFALEPKGAVEGWPCDRMQTFDAEREFDVCLAAGLPSLPLHLFGGALGQAVPFGATLREKGLFPLSVEVRRRTRAPGTLIRAIAARLSVVEIERGLVPDRAFELPDYPKVRTTTLTPPRLVR
jgi:hypothetical protein